MGQVSAGHSALEYSYAALRRVTTSYADYLLKRLKFFDFVI